MKTGRPQWTHSASAVKIITISKKMVNTLRVVTASLPVGTVLT